MYDSYLVSEKELTAVDHYVQNNVAMLWREHEPKLNASFSHPSSIQRVK
jgi:hypothetical protein